MKKKSVVKKHVSAPKDTSKKRHTFSRLTLMLFIIFIAGVALTATIYIQYKVLDYFVLNTSVNVVTYNVAGLNVDNESLIFGRKHPGGGSIRYFDLESKEQAFVIIKTRGDMSKFLTYSDNQFIIAEGEVKRIAANLEIPKDTLPGNYTGKIHVYFLRP